MVSFSQGRVILLTKTRNGGGYVVPLTEKSWFVAIDDIILLLSAASMSVRSTNTMPMCVSCPKWLASSARTGDRGIERWLHTPPPRPSMSSSLNNACALYDCPLGGYASLQTADCARKRLPILRPCPRRSWISVAARPQARRGDFCRVS
jgi:hypothetical protein